MHHVFALALVRPGFLAGQTDTESGQLVEEFFLSDTVFPQEADELQVRASALGQAGNGLTSFSFEYGLTDRLQVELDLDGPSWGSPSGESQGEFGLQQSFLGITPWELHAAVSFDSEFSDSGGLPEQGVGFAVGKNLAWLHGVHLFAGTRHVLRRGGEAALLGSGETTSGEPEDARNEWFAGIVVATHRTIRITNEWNSMQAEHAWIESPKRLHWTPGLVWKLPTWGEAGIAVSLPLQGPSRSPWVTVSFTREFDGIFGRNVE